MKLGELLTQTPVAAADVEIDSLALDDRKVKPGTLFFCVRGLKRDGHEFASSAIERGAAALVVDHPLGSSVPEVIVPDVRSSMAPVAARFHGDPTSSLTTIGITGTNGKTTTSFLVRSILEAAGKPSGIIGTVSQIVAGEQLEGGRTTPEAIDLHGLFARMLAGGDSCCVMEVSSHALDLARADAIHWAAVAFTNLTQDHLDFHETMENYFAAKVKLFEAAPEGAVMVIDIDGEYGQRLHSMYPKAVTVGIDNPDAELRASDIRAFADHSEFQIGELSMRVPIPGRFNVRNALSAFAICRGLGVDPELISSALAKSAAVPGRMQPVSQGQPFAVLVDYAHTADSLHQALTTARETTSGKLLCVFGAGGDRDREKRPAMGKVASELADVAIITTDNPRSEDPAAIISEVFSGADTSAKAQIRQILDRDEAIREAIALAGPGDVVVIAGKGHEQGQQFGDQITHFDDVEVAQDALSALGWDAQRA